MPASHACDSDSEYDKTVKVAKTTPASTKLIATDDSVASRRAAKFAPLTAVVVSSKSVAKIKAPVSVATFSPASVVSTRAPVASAHLMSSEHVANGTVSAAKISQPSLPVPIENINAMVLLRNLAPQVTHRVLLMVYVQ